MASYKVGQVLFPEVSRMQGQGDEAGAARLAVNASWLLTTLSAMLFVPLVVFAHDLLRLYLNTSMADNSTAVLRILAIGTGVGCTFAIPSFYLLGTGRSRWLAAMSLLYGVATFAGCFFLIPVLGISGAGWGMSVATTVHVCTLILLWWRVLNRWIPGRVYLASTFAPFLVACGIGLGGILVWDTMRWDMGWIGLGTMGVLLAVVSAAAIAAVDGVLPGGRQRRELLLTLVQKTIGFVGQRLRKNQ
jgi:O-antigen/teichoic acid export membrane protein